MSKHIEVGNAVLYHGDCLEVLRTLPDNSIDSIVTDPPYGLSFMGKKWDYDVPSQEIWEECLRVLKPGGHLLAFAGTRTQHRMAVRIEDAGFEIRDMVAWVYGSGFPKSLDVSKAIDKAMGAEREVVGQGISGATAGMQTLGPSGIKGGAYDITAPATYAARQWSGWGTALKPAMETITVARKPLIGTVAENVLAHGTGALNIDGCRVECGVRPLTVGDRRPDASNIYRDGLVGSKTAGETTQGRWPANLIHDGSDEVLALFPKSKGQQGPITGSEPSRPAKNTYGEYKERRIVTPRGDTGSAARFFKQIEVTDAEWLENLSPALTAGSTLSLSKLADAIAQSDAAISALPEGRQLNVLKAPSTSVTPSESKLIATSVITAIQSIASASLLAQQPEKLSLSHSRVSVVAHQTPTGITMITASLSSSAGCAESITFSITPKSLAVGEKDCGQSPARFMYCAKASRKDRDEGLDGFEKRANVDWPQSGLGVAAPRGAAPRANNHPTVKPTDLMRYLVRLVTPANGLVLDPFMGSGSTGKAAMLEGFRFVGIERESDYIEIAQARIAHAAKGKQDLTQPKDGESKDQPGQSDLFAA